jgi:hypothetical protein
LPKKKLQEYDWRILLQEIIERGSNLIKVGHSYGSDTSEVEESNIASIDSSVIIDVLRMKQYTIFGVDDRADLCNIVDEEILNSSKGVCAIFLDDFIKNNGDGSFRLEKKLFREKSIDIFEDKICPEEEPFADQPIGAYATGFLVKPDVICTSGHWGEEDLSKWRIVFGHKMIDDETAIYSFDKSQVFYVDEVIGREYVSKGEKEDWALLKLDKTTKNQTVLNVRKGKNKIGDDQAVYAIGHPQGLPMKYAGGSKVRKNSPKNHFLVNTDTYAGNSGSPIFNADTHEVEGVLSRGEEDFRFIEKDGCYVSLICRENDCIGEEVTRASMFAHLL